MFPVYVFAADSVNVPVPVLFVNAPAPEIPPLNSWADDDEYVKVLVDDVNTIPPVYTAPTPSVPDTVMLPPNASIVVLPKYVFAPDNVNVPAADFCNVPEPETTPA